VTGHPVGRLHAALAEPGWHLLLCGPTDGWPGPDGHALRRLGLTGNGTDLAGLTAYLHHWFTPAPPAATGV
jgi:hypothetical protein